MFLVVYLRARDKCIFYVDFENHHRLMWRFDLEKNFWNGSLKYDFCYKVFFYKVLLNETLLPIKNKNKKFLYLFHFFN